MSSSISDTPAYNEIRVRKNAEPLRFVYEAFCLFEKMNEVILSGIGMAINHVVEVAEMTKRRMAGVHQLCELGMKDVISTKSFRGDGRRGLHNLQADDSTNDSHNHTFDRVKVVPYIKITLSKTGEGINKYDVGYQEPLKPQDVTVLTTEEVKQELENIKLSARHRTYRRGFRGYPFWSYKRYRFGRDRFDRDRFERDRFLRDRYGRERFPRDRMGRDRFERDRFGRDRDRFDRIILSRDRYRIGGYRRNPDHSGGNRIHYIEENRRYNGRS